MKRIIPISVLLLSVLLLFNGCEKKDKIQDYRLTDTLWYEVYYEGDIEVEQTFIFYSNGLGYETITDYYSSGLFEPYGFPFEWDWIKGGTTIALYYEDGDYMEFVVTELNKHRLTGYLDGAEVYFNPR